MKAEIRSLSSPDAPDLRNYIPLDAGDFGLLVTAMIGPAGEEEADAFEFLVCSPKWLAGQLENAAFMTGRDFIFLRKFSYEGIQQAIWAICQEAQGEDWEDLAAQLDQYGEWEYREFLSDADPDDDFVDDFEDDVED